MEKEPTIMKIRKIEKTVLYQNQNTFIGTYDISLRIVSVKTVIRNLRLKNLIHQNQKKWEDFVIVNVIRSIEVHI